MYFEELQTIENILIFFPQIYFLSVFTKLFILCWIQMNLIMRIKLAFKMWRKHESNTVRRVKWHLLPLHIFAIYAKYYWSAAVTYFISCQILIKHKFFLLLCLKWLLRMIAELHKQKHDWESRGYSNSLYIKSLQHCSVMEHFLLEEESVGCYYFSSSFFPLQNCQFSLDRCLALQEWNEGGSLEQSWNIKDAGGFYFPNVD